MALMERVIEAVVMPNGVLYVSILRNGQPFILRYQLEETFPDCQFNRNGSEVAIVSQSKAVNIALGKPIVVLKEEIRGTVF